MSKHDLPAHHHLAANIRRLVKEQERTLTQLPFEAGVNPSHFWKVMRRDSEPRLSWIVKVAEALGVLVHELLIPVEGDDEE